MNWYEEKNARVVRIGMKKLSAYVVSYSTAFLASHMSTLLDRTSAAISLSFKAVSLFFCSLYIFVSWHS